MLVIITMCLMISTSVLLVFGNQEYSHFYDNYCLWTPLSVSGRPCYILPMFFYIYLFFMAALFSGPG